VKSKIAVVARREFLTTVRRPSYLIATFGMPVFALLIGAVALIPALAIAKKEGRARTFGIVDLSGALRLTEPADFVPDTRDEIEKAEKVTGRKDLGAIAATIAKVATLHIRPYENLAAGQKAMRRGEIESVFVFPENFVHAGRIDSYQKAGMMGPGKAVGTGLLGRFVQERLFAERVDADLMERLRRPFRVDTFTLQKDGTFAPQNLLREIAGFIVPFLFCILFFISIMISSGFMLQGLSEEKENRVMEVILSSIRSDGLLAGKLVGLGGAGLLQIAVWMLLALGAASGKLSMIPFQVSSLLWSFVFYILGFLLFGVLLMGTGSLGQNLKEVQQYGMMWSLASVIPLIFWTLLVNEPNGALARVLSFVPLTAPATMFLRLHSFDPPPWWESVLSAAILAVSCWIALKVMARLFRVGLLLYGKRPTIPEILRHLRRPAA